MLKLTNTCGSCAGSGYHTFYTVSEEHDDNGYNVCERDEQECLACNGKGYIEYVAFTVEEARVILEHCGLEVD